VNGFELIIPYLTPIRPLLSDPEVTEVMVNNGGRVSWEKAGKLCSDGMVLDRLMVEQAIQMIARRLGGNITPETPILDSRLPDGSRVAAVVGVCSPDGPTLTIRRFAARTLTLDDLIAGKSVSPHLAGVLIEAVADKQNILICGGTGTGKTTLINVLAQLIPLDDRIVLIEDTSEIRLSHPNAVRFEARNEPGKSVRDLLKHSLRHRPDRLILGEVRGAEAWDLLQLCNTGHKGTAASLHADSPLKALSRLATCALQSGIEMPWWALQHEIADSVNLVVEMKRDMEGRRVAGGCLRVLGFNDEAKTYETEEL
jgi:pilus assembly protein CpaF